MTDDNRSALWKLAALLLTWAVTFAPIMPSMVDTWLSHSDNSHALVVPLVSLYFIWDKRTQLSQLPTRGSSSGLLLLVLCLLFYLLSFLGGIAFFARLMLVASLIAVVWSYLGTAMVRTLAFPLGFLFFMVPIPDTLLSMVSSPLQLLATKISADLIRFCSIPVYREGNLLFFTHTQLEVAEACSGIRSIMSLTMISTVFAYISTGVNWHKLVLVVAAVPVAFIANILRVTGTGILAHFYGDKVASGFLHDLSGLAVFMFGLIMLLGLSVLLKHIGRSE